MEGFNPSAAIIAGMAARDIRDSVAAARDSSATRGQLQQLVDDHNVLVDDHNGLLASHHRLCEFVNDLVAAHNDLLERFELAEAAVGALQSMVDAHVALAELLEEALPSLQHGAETTQRLLHRTAALQVIADHHLSLTEPPSTDRILRDAYARTRDDAVEIYGVYGDGVFDDGF